MPHIDIKCYPKHLTTEQFNQFTAELVELAKKHLHAADSDVSIRYTEIPADQWKAQVWDKEIAPHLNALAKRPGYDMN